MNKAKQLGDLYRQLESQALSLPLVTKPQDIVPGEGDPQATIFLIGEAPGFHEQVQRRPFVGRSGQLLRKTLTELGIPPETVYIGNIVKARPPDNRDPSPEEIKAFKPYLDEEIKILNPQLIVTLGRFSMAKFLADVRISQVHGRLHRVKWNDEPRFILPMYHPAAALRGTNIAQQFKQDMAKIPLVLDWIKNYQQTAEFTDTVAQALS